MPAADLRLVIICPSRTGTIARVSGFIANLGGSINEASHYSDPVSGMFFMRYGIAGDTLPFREYIFCKLVPAIRIDNQSQKISRVV